MTATTPGAPRTPTGSRTTRILGSVVLVLVGLLFFWGWIVSPPEVEQGDAVRLFYIHVPVATSMYVPVGLCAVGSVMWLWRKSVWWDTLAAASAEVGALLVGLCLVTGALWGRPTWGTYWDWDPRLTSTALMFLMLLGYTALRKVPADRAVRNRRSAVVGLALAVNVPIVHFAVDWWRSLHQNATVATLDPKLDGSMYFAFFLGMVTFLLFTVWVLFHRFRLQWLEDQADDAFLEQAIAERRQEAGVDR